MATLVIPPTSSDPSMADLRAMLQETAPVVEAKPEPVAAPVAEATKPEAAPEAADKTQEPEVKEEPLPKGVQKKIAQEVERASGIQRKIDEAVSNRKAKEKELVDVTAKPGSEPAPTTAAAKDAKPVKPEFGTDGQTWGQYQEALAKYETDRESWLLKETRSAVEQEFTQRQQQAAAKERWDAAVKTHGAEFPKLMKTAQELAPEGLQQAISALDDWSAVAVHLAKNPAKLTELAEVYKASPVKAIATLGRIEASLKPATKTAAAPLPTPPATAGGGASASTGAFDYETSSMSQVSAHLRTLKKRR